MLYINDVKIEILNNTEEVKKVKKMIVLANYRGVKDVLGARGFFILDGHNGLPTLQSSVLIVVNPKSKRQIALRRAIQVANKLVLDGKRIMMVYSEKNGRPKINPDPNVYGLVIIAGGDGTISRFLTAYYGYRLPTVAIIPGGTTNEFAAQHGITSENFLSVIINGVRKNCDISVINNERIAVYSITAGQFTDATYKTSQALKNVLGKSAYVLYGITHWSGKLVKADLVIDQTYCYSINSLFIGMTNTRTIGGGMVMLPVENEELHDGKNELFIVSGLKSFREYVQLYHDVLHKNVFSNDNVHLELCREVLFTFPKKMTINVDGEGYECGKTAHIRTLPDSLYLIC